MTESLASLLMKNIDLILEAYNVDERGNLVEVNKRKVQESDAVFHNYFVKSMNNMFRQINENDPITPYPNNDMDPMHGAHGMGDEFMGMGDHMGGPTDDMGLGGDMGHMTGRGQMRGMSGMNRGRMGAEHMGMPDDMGDMDELGEPGVDSMLADTVDMDQGMGGGMGGPMGGSSMGGAGGPMGESSEKDFDWVFNEEADLDVDSLFNLTEDDEDGEDEEDVEECDMEESALNEFGGMHGGMHHMMDDDDDDMGGMGGSMGLDGGANDFGGDMSGMGGGMSGHMGGGMDDMGGGMDDMGGGMDDMGGGDADMVTIHGTTDGGGDFEFSFDPNTLGFDGGDMGGGDMGGGPDHGGGDHHEFGGGDEDSFGGEEHHFGGSGGGSHHDEEGEEEKEPPVSEAKKPRRGKTGRMSIVPSDPATKHAVPFPTPQGTRQKRK